MKRQFQTFAFNIQNSTSDSVDIYIDGQIVDAATQEIYKLWFGDDTSVSFKSFRNQLEALDAKTFNIYINSQGGLVTDAMAIHDYLISLQNKGKTVNCIGRGIIASAATYILMASKNSTMSKNSWFMIHNVSGGTYGDVNEIENYATMMRKFNDTVRDFYANATGKRKEDISKMMDAETWMTADDALKNGFIKAVESDSSFTNAIEKDNWLFNNLEVLSAYNSAVKMPPTPPTQNSFKQEFDEMKKFFQNLADKLLNSIKAVKAPENNDHSALMASIGQTISDAFTNQADAFESEVNTVVNTAVANAVKTAVDNQVGTLNTTIQNLQTEVTNLQTKNTDLEKEITNLKGSQTSGGNDGGEGGQKAIGNFSN